MTERGERNRDRYIYRERERKRDRQRKEERPGDRHKSVEERILSQIANQI